MVSNSNRASVPEILLLIPLITYPASTDDSLIIILEKLSSLSHFSFVIHMWCLSVPFVLSIHSFYIYTNKSVRIPCQNVCYCIKADIPLVYKITQTEKEKEKKKRERGKRANKYDHKQMKNSMQQIPNYTKSCQLELRENYKYLPFDAHQKVN